MNNNPSIVDGASNTATTTTENSDSQVDYTNNPHIIPLPPLPSVNVTAISYSTPVQRPNAFEVNNTVRKESVKRKRDEIENDGIVVHPVKLPFFQRFLNQSNMRRVPEEEEETFKSKMIPFLVQQSQRNCWSQPLNSVGKCDCLRKLLSVEFNRDSVVDMVCAYWQLHLHSRDSLFSNKVYAIMDKKEPSKLKSASNVKFRGRLFKLKGMFKEADGSEVTNFYDFCTNAYLSLYGIGYYEFQSVKKSYDASCFDIGRASQHGLVGKKGNNRLTDEVCKSLRSFLLTYLKKGMIMPPDR